jgi:hypothetical protein
VKLAQPAVVVAAVFAAQPGGGSSHVQVRQPFGPVR